MPQRFAQNKVLGLAIGERSLVVAEASRAGGDPRITLAANFDFPEGMSLDQPGPLGQALASFLKDRGFTARFATVGLPARWVLSKSKEVPPADADVAAEALRLQLESEFTSEIRDLSFDYVGQVSPSAPASVLLVAVPGRRIESVRALLDSAGLKPAGVAPLGVVLGAATATAGGRKRSALVVSVGPAGVELSAQDGATPRALRHLGAANATAGALAGELRRAAMSVSSADNTTVNGNGNGHVNGNGSANGHGLALVLWDGSALTETARRVLADAAGAKLETGDLLSLGVPAGITAGGRDLGGAAALAVATLSDDGLPVNFLQSKLAEPKAPLIAQRTKIIALVATLLVLLVLLPIIDLWNKERTLASLAAMNKANIDKVKEANAFSEKVQYANSWRSGDPVFLACMLELLNAVPQDLRTYVLTVNINQDMSGSVTGRSSRESDAHEVASRMKQNPQFKEVRLQQLDPRSERGSSSEIGFRIDFKFVPPKATTTRPATAPAARPSR